MQIQSIKILIAGVGGVGGYFGGLLAKKYAQNKSIEIFFLARNEHLQIIKSNGLQVIHGEHEWISHPTLASDNPSDFGKIDILFLCTKSYDLPETLLQLKPCIHSETKLICLLNGVDHITKIKQIYPKNEIINGCAYIVSSIKTPGIVENVGKVQKLFFGKSKTDHFILEKLMKEAEIDVICDENIEAIVWEKFIFLSPIATITSFYQKTVGEIIDNYSCKEELVGLINEVYTLALKKQISLESNCIEKTLEKYAALPPSTTTSMQRDFTKNAKKTEIESLTGYVVQECEKLKIGYPFYNRFYTTITAK